LKGLSGEYEGKRFTDVSGVLEMMDNKGTLSEGKGFFKASSFRDLKGPWVRGEAPDTADGKVRHRSAARR
jgi:hypothetical protein